MGTLSKFGRELFRCVFPLALLIVSITLLISLARLVYLEDSQVARRALIYAAATDDVKRWAVTSTFRILMPIFQPIADSLFLLRLAGLAIVFVSSLLFSLVGLRSLKPRGERRVFIGAILFLAGCGLYAFHPNNVPEFNHLAVLYAACLLAIVTRWSFATKPPLVIEKFIVVAVSGFFLTVNLSSAFLGLLVFCCYWYLRSPNKSTLYDSVAIAIGAIVTYILISMFLGQFTVQSTTPGIVYYRVAISELEKYFFPRGNLLYMVLRTIAFAVEMAIVIPVCAFSYRIGRSVAQQKKQMLVYLLLGLPFAWMWVAAWFTYIGFDTFQTADRWTLSPSFFWGKFVWYGYATAFPVLVLLFFIIGTNQIKKLARPDLLLCAFLLLIPLSLCFGSAARVVHKIQMYMIYVLFVAIFLIEKAEARIISARLSYFIILLLLGSQFLLIQTIPFARVGGVSSFSYSLSDLPRGKGILVQRVFRSWIDDVVEKTKAVGMENSASVISNDFLLSYVLGVHQVTLGDDGKSLFSDLSSGLPRFGIILEELDPPEQSKLRTSPLLKIIGPPDTKRSQQISRDNYRSYFDAHGFGAVATVLRGDGARSVIFCRD